MKYDISHPNFLKEDHRIVQDRNGNTFFVYDSSAPPLETKANRPTTTIPNPYGLGILGIAGIASRLGPIPAAGSALAFSSVAQAVELKKQAEAHAQNIKISNANDDVSMPWMPSGFLRDIVMR